MEGRKRSGYAELALDPRMTQTLGGGGRGERGERKNVPRFPFPPLALSQYVGPKLAGLPLDKSEVAQLSL